MKKYPEWKQQTEQEAEAIHGQGTRVDPEQLYYNALSQLLPVLEGVLPEIKDLTIDERFTNAVEAYTYHIDRCHASNNWRKMVTEKPFLELIDKIKQIIKPNSVAIYQSARKDFGGIVFPNKYIRDTAISILGGLLQGFSLQERTYLEGKSKEIFTKEGNKDAKYVVTFPGTTREQTLYIPAFVDQNGHLLLVLKKHALDRLAEMFHFEQNPDFIRNNEILRSLQLKSQLDILRISDAKISESKYSIPVPINFNGFKKHFCQQYTAVDLFFKNRDAAHVTDIVTGYHDCNDNQDCPKDSKITEKDKPSTKPPEKEDNCCVM